jgi:hypothetical protein
MGNGFIPRHPETTLKVATTNGGVNYIRRRTQRNLRYYIRTKAGKLNFSQPSCKVKNDLKQ